MKLNDFLNLINANLNDITPDYDFSDLINHLTSLVEKLSDGKLTVSTPDNKCTYGYFKSVEYNEIVASFDIKKRKVETKSDRYCCYSYTYYTIKAVILSNDENGDADINDLLQDAENKRNERLNAKQEREKALIDFLKNYDFNAINDVDGLKNFKADLMNVSDGLFSRINRFYK